SQRVAQQLHLPQRGRLTRLIGGNHYASCSTCAAATRDLVQRGAGEFDRGILGRRGGRESRTYVLKYNFRLLDRLRKRGNGAGELRGGDGCLDLGRRRERSCGGRRTHGRGGNKHPRLRRTLRQRAPNVELLRDLAFVLFPLRQIEHSRSQQGNGRLPEIGCEERPVKPGGRFRQDQQQREDRNVNQQRAHDGADQTPRSNRLLP